MGPSRSGIRCTSGERFNCLQVANRFAFCTHYSPRAKAKVHAYVARFRWIVFGEAGNLLAQCLTVPENPRGSKFHHLEPKATSSPAERSRDFLAFQQNPRLTHAEITPHTGCVNHHLPDFWSKSWRPPIRAKTSILNLGARQKFRKSGRKCWRDQFFRLFSAFDIFSPPPPPPPLSRTHAKKTIPPLNQKTQKFPPLSIFLQIVV